MTEENKVKCDCGEDMFNIYFHDEIVMYRCIKCDVIKDKGELNK